MQIPIENISKSLEKGLTIQQYIYLLCISDGCIYLFPDSYFENKGENIVLTNLELITFDKNYQITPKGKALLQEIEGVKEEVSKKVDNKYEELHKKLQNKLIELTGSKQKTLNKKYSFLCNSQDLASKLSKVIKKYKLNNWNKIESLLLQHIINSYKANWEYVLLIEYYIEKNNSSKLATDYDNFEDKQEEIEVKIEPKDIKNLF